jgi:hypothetical protein
MLYCTYFLYYDFSSISLLSGLIYPLTTPTPQPPKAPDIEGLERREQLKGPGEGCCAVGAEFVPAAGAGGVIVMAADEQHVQQQRCHVKSQCAAA